MLQYFGGRFCGTLESDFDRRQYGDNVDARDLEKRNFWAFCNTVYCCLFFTRWCHLVFHGVSFRGFEDPGLRANHDRFRGVLDPLPPDILAWINEWGVRHLLRGSTVSPHPVDTALSIVRLIDWARVPVASHLLGLYYRYCSLTGEVDSVPRRRVAVVGGRNYRPSSRELLEIPLVFRDG